MADQALVRLDANVLPSEIRTRFSGLAAKYSPADNTEGWYYKLTDITTTSSALIASDSYLSKGGTDRGADSATASATASYSDKLKFLLVIHTGTQDDGTTMNEDSVYLNIDGSTAAHNGATCIEIGYREAWYGKMNNTAVADINVIAGASGGSGTASNKIQCIVAAILDDV